MSRLALARAVAATLAFAASIAFILVAPHWDKVGDIKGAQMGTYFIAIVGLNIVTGYTGQISLAQGAFMEQWFFKITAYADQLLDDLALIDWPERTKTIQRNWIGRSEGAEVLFRDEELDLDIPVFTTRPDTLFGATFFVLAPEHPLVEKLANDEVRDYVQNAGARSVEERQTKDKDGVFTGHHVVNPVNDERIPVWVADYVLMDYGTGAIMAVPAHDERDREFAEYAGLPIQPVIDEETGVLVDSGQFTGQPAHEAIGNIVEWLRDRGRGAPAISYRLRDWSMSRQRYWGCPIPIVYCEEHGAVAVPEDELPVVLPEIDDYRPQGMLVYLIGLSRFVGQIAALAAIGGYVLAVGWQPSVVRAGVAGVLASLAWLVSRPSDRWYFLLLGAALLLAWSPYSLLDAGFQLSFAAVGAIFLVVPRLQQTLAGYPVPHSLAEVVAVSGACGLATAPILLTQFGVVPLYSIPANALAAPVVAPLLGIALITAIVAPVAPPLAVVLAWVNGWLAAYLAACAHIVGGLPYAAVSARTAVVVAAVVLGVAYLLARLRRPQGRMYVAIALAAALIAGGWKLHGSAPPPPPTGLRIAFLDVGQGDGALIQVPGGAVLVDEGPPEAKMASQLRHLGVTSLSLLVLTHPQRDHVGGAADVLKKLRVGAVLDPAIPTESQDERAARTVARERGVRIIVARAGEAFRIGGLRLRVLWPDGPGTPGDDPNNHAIVLVATYGQTDALFTADAESDVTGRLQLPPVEILKVAHHGSADAGLGNELKELRPQIAVISVGAGNDYGHPTPSTLATLAAVPGLSVYRTDLNGRVVVESDGRRISVRTSR